MDRRRALLSAIQTSGGKIVNHGVLKLESFGNYKSYWEYPVESRITTVVVSDSPSGTRTEALITAIGNDVSWNSYLPGPGESLSHIESVTPAEDDTYIYEVTIE